MTVFVTQSDIQLSGPGLIGSDVAGSGVRRSKRITIGAGLSLVEGELVNTLDLSGYLTTATAASTYLPLAGGTLVGDLKFTDATYDIGKSGLTRPRDGFFSRNLTANKLSVGGASLTGYINLPEFQWINWGGTNYIKAGNTYDGVVSVSIIQGGTLADIGAIVPYSNTLKIRYSTNAQALQVYETYTSDTSFGTLQIKANAGAAYQIGSAIGSAGGTSRNVSFGSWNAAGTFTTGLVVGTGGYVGINSTAAPAYPLDVNGIIRCDNQIVMGGSNPQLSRVTVDGTLSTTVGYLEAAVTLIGNFPQQVFAKFMPGEAYFGDGQTKATPLDYRFNATGGSGTNIAGASFTLAGGKGTGTGLGGSVKIQVAPAGSTGSSANSLVDALVIDSTKKATFSGEINVTNAFSQTLRIAMDTNNPIISSATTRMIMGGTAVWLKTDGGVSFVNSSDSEMGKVTISSFNLTLQSNTNGSLNLIVPTSVNGNQGGNAVNIVGQTAASNSVSVLNGGAVNITGGNGASASAGNAYGGDIVLTPGVGYGSGRQGVVSVLGPITNISTGITEIRYGTTAQTLRLYSTYTSTTNFESLTFAPTTSAINIGLQVGSAGGTSTRNINIGHWDSSGTFITRFTSATSVTQAISDTTCVFRLYGHGGVATGTQIQCYKARGTDRNTKLYPVSGDIFGGLNCYGYDESTSNWSTSKGAYIITASGNWTSTANGTQHTWQVTNSADATKTLTTVMTLTTDGSLNPLCGINSTKLIRQNAEVTYTPTGTTQTITLNDGNHQTLNLTSATGTVTATLTVPTSSSAGTIIVNQHASAAKGITWAVSSGTIKWMGTQPTWSSDATSSVRLVSWRWNGSIMYLVATDVGT